MSTTQTTVMMAMVMMTMTTTATADSLSMNTNNGVESATAMTAAADHDVVDQSVAYANCYLGTLQAHGDTMDACPAKPKGFSWRKLDCETLATALESTKWRRDWGGRLVAVPFNGTCDEDGRLSQAEPGLLGFEGGKVWKDRKPLTNQDGVQAVTGLQGPPFWAKAGTMQYWFPQEEESELRELVENLKDAVLDSDGESLLTQAQERLRVVIANDRSRIGALEGRADQLLREEFDEDGQFVRYVGVVAAIDTDLRGIEEDVHEIQARQARMRFRVEVSVGEHFEEWRELLDEGITVDIRPTTEFILGVGGEHFGNEVTVRGVARFGVHTGAGFTAGGRVDIVGAPSTSPARFGVYGGVDLRIYHVLPEAVVEGAVLSRALGLRGSFGFNAEFLLGQSVTLSPYAGISGGHTWVGDTPHARVGADAGIRLGASF